MAMELETLLAQWRSIESVMVLIDSIQTDAAYQPRIDRLPPYKDQGRVKEASQQHIEVLTNKLSDGRDLDPLLLARIDGQLFLIDGHHRLDAYRKAKRTTIPACIRDSTKKQATRASLAVNCDFVKRSMHPEQRRDAAWQYIGMLTKRGTRDWPKGISRRDIGRTFGVSHDTIATMARTISRVNLTDFTPEACHPGTRWPHWKYVKGNAWRDVFNDVPSDIRDQHRVERLAVRYGLDIEKYGIDIFKRAVELVAQEVKDERLESIKWDEEQGWDY